jgi:UDP-glucose 4-epimerase
VYDVVCALERLMAHPDSAGQVYNLGTDREVSMEQLADMIIGLTQSKSEKKHLSYEQAYGRPFDDMLRRVPCLDRIRKMIGYQPQYALEQTLELVIQDVRNRQK